MSLECGFWGPKELHGPESREVHVCGHICTWLTRRLLSIFSTIFAIGRQQRCGLWLSVYCSKLLLCLQTASSGAEFRQTSPWLHRRISSLQHCRDVVSVSVSRRSRDSTKFRKDRPNRYGDIAIFVIFKMAAAAILNFQKFKILTVNPL